MREKVLNLVEAVAAIYISYRLLPLVETWWPDLPAWAVDIGTLLAVALIVAVVSLLLWQRPRVEVSWKQRSDPAPLADLRMRLRPPRYVSPQFEVSFKGRPKGMLTMLLMTYLRRRLLRLTVVPIGAPVVMTVPVSSPIDANTSVGAADVANGFSVRVHSPAQPETWIWAKVFFTATTGANDTFTMAYGATASTKPAQLLSKLVQATSKVEVLIIN